ncbi:MAG: glycosyltransferase family 9 protein [Ginsengibacter sp.]
MNTLKFEILLKDVPLNILINRADSIGDVVLALPIAKYLKEFFPAVKIGFLGRNYTRSVIEACENVDEFIEYEDFLNKPVKICGEVIQCILHVWPNKLIAKRAKKLKIPLRIGTTNRLFHWSTCNKLIRLSRKNSYLHEAKLNLKLLEAFRINKNFSLEEIRESFGLTKIEPLESSYKNLIDKNKFNLIIHPKSQGNAREWSLSNFAALINLLDREKYKIFISGTEKEGKVLKDFLALIGNKATNITGKMKLSQFISFINSCDGLIANSTGPLHITAALGKNTYGIFAPMWPINDVRWGPLGKNAKVFVIEKNCNDCRKNRIECKCIQQVDPFWIKAQLDKDSS